MPPLTQRKQIEETRKVERPRFGVFDAKKREIGCRIVTLETEFYIDADHSDSGYRMEPGRYFSANIQATRSGVEYGASQSWEHFKTEAERDAYIAKRIADSRKRAEKIKAA